MQKISTAKQVFRDHGLTGVAYVALMKLPIGVGKGWLINRLICKHDPYSDYVRSPSSCPHCHGSFEKTAEGLLCQRCQDVFIIDTTR